MFFALSAYGNCSSNFSTGASSHLTEVCGELDVDVNGFQPPNFYGRDIFRFYISNGKGAFLYPYSGIDDNRGYWKDNNYCVDIATGMDVACSARIIDEGWQMNY